MKKLFIIVFQLFAFEMFSQATEASIPSFTLDTDGDSMINIVDTDDDNDGVLDNLDAFPLDNTKSIAATLTSQVLAIADAGLRSTASAINYGSDATVLTRSGNTRSMLIKFTKPAIANVTSVKLTIFTSTELSPLAIYFIPNNSWSETGVTFDNAPTSVNTLLGVTGLPVGDNYTFDIPINILPASGDFTIWVHDNTTDGSNQLLYTKETAGKAPRIDFTYLAPITSRLVIDQSAGKSIYLGGADKPVGFKLSQMPTDNVYIPFSISDPSIAEITGNQVLTFTPSNWNTTQFININPLKPGAFDIAIRPLHSNDVTLYNGFNNEDLPGYKVQATDITNLIPLNTTTGSDFTYDLNAVSALGSSTFAFRIVSGPVGMGVVESSGLIKFHPLSHQVGTFPVTVEVKDDKGNISLFNTSITVTNGGIIDPAGIYVVPNAIQDPMENGTPLHPYNNFVEAVNAAGVAGGGNVYVRGGEYTLLEIQNISTVGSSANPIVIQPSIGENVKFNFNLTNGFEFRAPSRHIEFKGFEIDGGTDNVEFWCLPAQAFWGDRTVFRGGGIAIGVDGENITIRENYIHNCYQKAVEMRAARYLKVYHNIIHSIATTSLSGGHGIMRQQAGDAITTPDNGIDFRWDLDGNLVYNVEQRIYSWVPSKEMIDMVLDEGKPILIDDPSSDAAAISATMKARIENNVVAYGSLDHIRLKSTNNLTVKNNSVYSAAPTADGITDKVGDTNKPQFTGTVIANNAVHMQPGTVAYDLKDILDQGGTPPNVAPTIMNNSYVLGAVLLPPTGIAGVTSTAAPLFVDPNNGNFRRASTTPANIGASTATFDILDIQKAKFGVDVKWDRWETDHLLLTQTILDNNPGINDGIPGNDTIVLTNFGRNKNLTTSGPSPQPIPDFTQIHFDMVIGSSWQKDICKCPTKTREDFHLNEEYVAWYIARNMATKDTGTVIKDYARIRWGNSILKQDQLFVSDWLTVAEITPDTNTVIYGKDENFRLDGDLLVDFEGFTTTPAVGSEYDLIKAKTIVAEKAPNYFKKVIFEGFTPANYSLTVVDVDGIKALRLKILSPCDLNVSSKADDGPGSLRAAIGCAVGGDTIRLVLSNGVAMDTIKLTTPLTIDKVLNFKSAASSNSVFLQNCSSSNIMNSGDISMENFHILSDTFINNSNLKLTNMIFRRKDGMGTMNFINQGTMQVIQNVSIE
jgi:hypothetical protein